MDAETAPDDFRGERSIRAVAINQVPYSYRKPQGKTSPPGSLDDPFNMDR